MKTWPTWEPSWTAEVKINLYQNSWKSSSRLPMEVILTATLHFKCILGSYKTRKLRENIFDHLQTVVEMSETLSKNMTDARDGNEKNIASCVFFFFCTFFLEKGKRNCESVSGMRKCVFCLQKAKLEWEFLRLRLVTNCCYWGLGLKNDILRTSPKILIPNFCMERFGINPKEIFFEQHLTRMNYWRWCRRT